MGVGTARELVGFFLEESRDRLNQMADLAATLDQADHHQTLTRDAHSLKSAAQTYGLPELGEAARKLEMACRDTPQGGDGEAIIQRYQDLADMAGDQLAALENYVDALPPEN